VRRTDEELAATVRDVLRRHARLAVDPDELDGGADLYDAGMTSFASVNVMLMLEEEVGVEFEDRMLSRATFQTIDSVRDALRELLDVAAATAAAGARA
jgi:acyl carrier protein